MLAKRIIACLDVRDGVVVKGIQFQKHQVVGDIIDLATRYSEAGIDELVFYDITASSDRRVTDKKWITEIAKQIAIPFSVAGGISSLEQARSILYAGADKILINSPALANPDLINQLSHEFGQQCITVGIDSKWLGDDFYVFQYTGDVRKSFNSQRTTTAWLAEVQDRGAGEIVLNCMSSDGVRRGYDLPQLALMAKHCQVPLIASGGAGSISHFIELFNQIAISGALAASVFHHHVIEINDLKQALKQARIEVRDE
jgi:cyclase